MSEHDDRDDGAEPEVPHEDPDRDAIVARRNRFIAIAMSGLASTATAGCYESHELGDVVDAAPDASDAEPRPCLSRPADVGPPPPLDAGMDAEPRPCLDVAPMDSGTDAEPTPCLSAPLDSGPATDGASGGETTPSDAAVSPDADAAPCLFARVPDPDDGDEPA